jgi:hypothetical protein
MRFVPIRYELENGGVSIASLNFVIDVVVPEPFVLDGSPSQTFSLSSKAVLKLTHGTRCGRRSNKAGRNPDSCGRIRPV